MDRRAFLVGAAGLLGAPLVAEAQPIARAHRVGFLALNPITPGPAGPTLVALREELKELGYSEGKNLALEARFADGRRERLPVLLEELLRLRIDVLVTFGTPATAAGREAKTGVPIVFIGVGDPVGAGFAQSLARPGGNFTGISFVGPELAAKNLELLKDAAPGASRVAVLIAGDGDQPLSRSVWTELERAARVLNVALQRLQVPAARERLDEVLSAMRSRRPDALLTLNDPFFLIHRDRILATAAELRLPTMFQTAEYVRAGGLLAYVPSYTDQGQQAGRYIDKILSGTKPGGLAIQQPTKFELTINLKTAKTLGLTIPPALLLRADQVIE